MIHEVPVGEVDLPNEPRNELWRCVNELDLEWQESFRDVLMHGASRDEFEIVYGIDHERSSTYRFESVPLTDLESIHRQLNDKVLVDEANFIAGLVEAPDPRQVTGDSPGNSRAWLNGLSKGIWPMPLYRGKGNNFSLEVIYGIDHVYENQDRFGSYVWDHDYRNLHLANSILFPREIGNRVRKVASIELAWRDKGNNFPLLLPGEASHDYIPSFDQSWPERGHEERAQHVNGMRLLDLVTDQSSYLNQLLYLIKSDDSNAIVADLLDMEHVSQDAKKSHMPFGLTDINDRRFNDTFNRWLQFGEVAQSVVALENYILRHTEGRNITPEEEHQIFEETVNGILRVSQKIRPRLPDSDTVS